MRTAVFKRGYKEYDLQIDNGLNASCLSRVFKVRNTYSRFVVYLNLKIVAAKFNGSLLKLLLIKSVA